jgi:alpha-galactosidase/6-phospho-beta-glucosidase family protein
MKHGHAGVSDIVIAYIGGGSRGWAWKLMADLALEERLGGTVRLYDVREESARANAAIGNALRGRADVRGIWRYETARTPQEALEGADVVVISILPGSFKEMASDVHAPEKYGIWQSVGDTVGPGGLMRGLRTVPLYVDFARWIQRWCPRAWVINYTNPMALCVRTLYEVFPGIKAFGCCHEVFGTQELLAAMLAEGRGIQGVAREDVKVNPLGINHFTWLGAASYRGIDLLPLFGSFAEEHHEHGFREKGQEDDCFGCAHRVAFDLFRRHGMIATGGDRHLAEFMPPYYLANPQVVAAWKFSLTPVSWRTANARELEEKGRRILAGTDPFPLEHSGEEGVRLIAALLGLGEILTNANLPNQGQVKDIPDGAVVETNALVSRDSIQPLIAGKLPPDVNALVMRHVGNQETLLRAAINRDKKLAFNAFLNEPLVQLGVRDASLLFEEMLGNIRAFLPGWDL